MVRKKSQGVAKGKIRPRDKASHIENSALLSLFEAVLFNRRCVLPREFVLTVEFQSFVALGCRGFATKCGFIILLSEMTVLCVHVCQAMMRRENLRLTRRQSS